MNSIALSVILPAHNEVENIDTLLPHLHKSLLERGGTFEIIVVDNASDDGTADIARKHMATCPNLRIVSEKKLGYGRAVLAGMRAANGSVIAIMCSDNQVLPSDLCNMLKEMQERNLDFLKAVRDQRVGDGFFRQTISRIFNALFRRIFILRSYDINATPKIFVRTFMEKANLESTNWLIDAEMVIKAEKGSYAIAEMLISYQPRVHGYSKVHAHHLLEFLAGALKWTVRYYGGRLLASTTTVENASRVSPVFDS